MKVLVFPHHLELGGSQINAIELAAACRDRFGHDVVVFGTPGPAVELVEARGLRFLPAPAPRAHPSPAVMRALRAAVRSEAPDLVHAWDWPQCLDAFYGVHLLGQTPLVGSNMSMGVTRFLPRSMPLTYGTPALVEQAARLRRGPVQLLVPPVDTAFNAPGVVDGLAFRREYGVGAEELLLVIVSRLVHWLKLEGIERTFRAAGRLAGQFSVRVAVVGGGPAAERLQELARAVNAAAGRDLIILTGPKPDPRPAYAAADVALGMGGSILRAMAFGKACIVLGENGFSQPFTPDTSAGFLWAGFYGTGARDGADALYEQLRHLLQDSERRRQLGLYSRQVAESEFSLGTGAATLDALYRIATGSPPPLLETAAEAIRTGFQRVAGPLVPAALKRQLLSTR